MMAANSGSPEITKELLQHGADVNAKDEDGTTALTLAAHTGSAEVGRVLLSAGAKIDRANLEGETPLMTAAMNGNAAFVKLLSRAEQTQTSAIRKGGPHWFSPRRTATIPKLLAPFANPVTTPKRFVQPRRWLPSAATSSVFRSSASRRQRTAAAGAQRSPRAAVLLSLKLAQSSMMEFHQITSCVSCHHEGLGRMMTGSAQDHGFTLEPKLKTAQTQVMSMLTTAMQPLHGRR